VIGQGNGLDPDQRHALLEAFDLKGLAALLPAKTARERKALPAGQQQPVRLPVGTRQTLEEPAA
jgi:hypothetical protein